MKTPKFITSARGAIPWLIEHLEAVYFAVAVLLAGVSALWGGWALSPNFPMFDTSAMYRRFSRYAPEPVWGLVTLISGTMQFSLIWQRRWAAAAPFAVTLILWFTFSAWCYAITDIRSPACAIFAWFALGQSLVAFRSCYALFARLDAILHEATPHARVLYAIRQPTAESAAAQTTADGGAADGG